MMTSKNLTVPINLSSYYSSSNNHLIQVGNKIKVGKNMYRITPQRMKNKMMIYRLLRKKYFPCFIVTSVFNNTSEQKLTIKPYNF